MDNFYQVFPQKDLKYFLIVPEGVTNGAADLFKSNRKLIFNSAFRNAKQCCGLLVGQAIFFY